ncbi:hypothetical protein CPB97_009147 [Podila verticillata]|nr:hypothetical protein CPB97_009147 [Podila verticillata]
MGKTQAGKSTLVEHIKNYANPSYAIDRSLLGNGNLSKTESTRPFYIESNLPAYEAFRKDTGEILALDNLATNCEDEEDYREILFSREKDVGLRLAPHHPNEPSDLVEFRFLDTPGLNDTNDRDSSHAVNIISEMINTRSFNLIVIIVSYKNPLTQEQQLVLEYYANVFRGLHTRIMFLHTHVDYAEIHHTNTVHHLNMKMKNKALSKMFRRHEIEGTFDEENVREYPSLTIDLVSKKRPIINCLIRNTLREILKMATQPAVMLDTSIQNIERIRAITHPSKFNDDERKRIKQRFAAEAAKIEKPVEEEEADVGGQELEQINILLIGDVQSGKTSLVETFKLYADPRYRVKTDHIIRDSGRNEKVKITAFLADLHTFQIRKLKAGTDVYDVIDLEKAAKIMSEEDFEDLLNLKLNIDVIPNVGPKTYRFNVYEGPSLNESDEDYEKNIFSIHQTIRDSGAQFHQVLFTLAPGPITGAIRSTIRLFCDIFSDINSLFSFIHTKIDYPKLHVSNKQFQDSMNERQKLLQRYTQSTATPYLIDCNLQSNWPVQRGKTLNVVHDILLAATMQTPVNLGLSPPISFIKMAEDITHSNKQSEVTVSRKSNIIKELVSDIPINPDYSILLLGRSQSGKSSLVEHIRNYADSVDEGLSSQESTRAQYTVFKSSLPSYEAIQKDNGAILNVVHLRDMFSKDSNGSLEYHELLRSSEQNFVSRVSTHTASLPQHKSLTFMILDTPGINNSVKDDETILGLVSSRSFNLVLIVVSFWYPLTVELQLALEYYSRVIQGLHCNIAFLHTHVDYADHHPHNEDFYRNLKLRNLLLSRIFQDQGPSPEGKPRSHMVPKADEMEEHPSFTMDLRSDGGPITQCSNRITIREILQLAASQSPRRIGATKENMDQIRAIPHPRNFTDNQRRLILESISAEDEKQKSLFAVDDRLGKSYHLKDTSFHKTRTIYNELVDYVAPSSRSLRHVRSLSTTHQTPKTSRSLLMKKTSRMRAADTLLLKKADGALKNIQSQIYRHKKEWVEFNKKLVQLDLDYKAMDQNNANSNVDFALRNDMEVVFEDKYEVAAVLFTELYKRSMKFKEQSRVIEHMSVQTNNIDIEYVDGGKGFRYWTAFYRQKTFAAASLVVKIYAKKLDVNGNPVGETEHMTNIRAEQAEMKQKLTMAEARLKDLAHVQKEYNVLRNWIDRETLPRTVAQELNDAGVYEAKDMPFDKIKEIYLNAAGAYGMDSREFTAESQEDTDSTTYLELQVFDHEAKPKFSVLIMGKTQAGKSTLVQFVKKYVDRHYQINRSLIGRGNTALTAQPMRFVVSSHLPKYEVVEKEGGTVLDLSSDLADKGTDDEYRDLISVREEKYELREVEQDLSGVPSESVELMFLDTPGINDTNRDDSVHAENIIKEVIATRSFNLILFVFKHDNPLTQEQRIALNYYAKVLCEFRSSITFVFTHVGYDHFHHSNTCHRKAIIDRRRVLSHLFRNPDIDPCAAENISTMSHNDNSGPDFPYFTIDFVTKKRPVKQWMIRDTLRKILQRAVINPPSVMNTDKVNIDRIRSILHPTKMNEEQRKKRVCQPETTRREEPVKEILPARPSDGEVEQINILLIGDVQSGKSSLVEKMKLYADPSYLVNHHCINHGGLYDAEARVRITSFLSNLPTVEIRRLQGKNGRHDLVDIDADSRTLCEEDFDDVLNQTQSVIHTHIDSSGSQKEYRFNIYEGPSLNESAEDFEKNIFSIHKTITKSKAPFHQVLFTLAPGAITKAIKTTIKVCSDIFSDLSSLFTFVHTKIDYSRLHNRNKEFQEFVQERQRILWEEIHRQQFDKQGTSQQLISQQRIQASVEPFLIDCDFQTKWPVRQAKTQNVVREILAAATNQKDPVAMQSSLMKKTPKMIAIDTSLKWMIKDEFEETKAVIIESNAKQAGLLSALEKLDEDITVMVTIQTHGSTSNQGELVEGLEVVFQNRYEVKDEKYVARGSLMMEFDNGGRKIEHLDLSSENVEIEQQIGGKDFDHWMIIYRQQTADAAFLDVKLYSKKLVQGIGIEGEDDDLTALRQRRVELQKRLNRIEAQVMRLSRLQFEYYLLRDWISRASLPVAVMEALTAVKAYEVDEASKAPFDEIKWIYLSAKDVYRSDPSHKNYGEDYEEYFVDNSDHGDATDTESLADDIDKISETRAHGQETAQATAAEER